MRSETTILIDIYVRDMSTSKKRETSLNSEDNFRGFRRFRFIEN